MAATGRRGRSGASRPGGPAGRPVVGMATTGCVVLAAVLVMAVSAGPVAGASRGGPEASTVALAADTTTILPGTTTAPSTTVPPTTTMPPTTTTSSSVPATTTSRPARTTTTTVPATTTSTPAPAATSSKTPWALIAVIVVLVLAIVVVALLMRSRRRKGLEAEWRRTVVPAVSDAQLARESLLSGNAASDDPELRGAVAVQVERAAIALDGAARKAPDPEAGAMATNAAGSLRGLAFAVEADRLLRHGAAAPTGVQLAQADEARRARGTELNTALARLSARIGSPPGRPSRR